MKLKGFLKTKIHIDRCLDPPTSPFQTFIHKNDIGNCCFRRVKNNDNRTEL